MSAVFCGRFVVCQQGVAECLLLDKLCYDNTHNIMIIVIYWQKQTYQVICNYVISVGL